MNKSKKTTIILYSIIAVLVIVSIVFLLLPKQKEGVHAVIQVGNTIVEDIALEKAEDSVFSIEEKTGLPIEFEIKDHAIRFFHSNCPDQICVHSGFLKEDLDIASCLPNKTLLFIEARD